TALLLLGAAGPRRHGALRHAYSATPEQAAPITSANRALTSMPSRRVVSGLKAAANSPTFPCMTDEISSAGWVVQIMMLRHAGALDPFRYFNVAIADANKAVEATVKHAAPPKEAHVYAVRQLSSAEIAAIPLKTGEVRWRPPLSRPRAPYP